VEDDKLAEEAVLALRSATEIASEAQIDDALARMAGELTSLVERSNPVVLAVMRGGLFTAAGLCRYFRFPYQFDFAHATRYADGLTGGKLTWPVSPPASLAGRTVVVVDDIFDHGTTLRALESELGNVGVKEVFTAVLVLKRRAGSAEIPRINCIGIEIDDRYVFGCGMDYKGYWRGLPSLYALTV
jgi:hypoxanthine phosphoribosyltransferase